MKNKKTTTPSQGGSSVAAANCGQALPVDENTLGQWGIQMGRRKWTKRVESRQPGGEQAHGKHVHGVALLVSRGTVLASMGNSMSVAK